MPSNNTLINNAFIRLSRRAEVSERNKLVTTFVDVGPLFTLLSSRDHQVMYGRRGTGKTHALSYLAETVERHGDEVSFVDMRNLGSSGGIYGDESIPLSERATRLLMDTLAELHDRLLEYMILNGEEFDLSYTGPILDDLADAITQVKVVGTHEKEASTTHGQESQKEQTTSLSTDTASGIKAGVGTTSAKKQSQQTQYRSKEIGTVKYTVHFGAVGKLLGKLTDAIKPKRIWLLLDEWSHIPLDLQPYLGDLLRRSVFPVRGATVKIGAIEQRSKFQISLEQGGYIGLELGADIAADVKFERT